MPDDIGGDVHSVTLQIVNRKILVLAIIALQVAVFGGLVVWRVVNWNTIGWAGMAYQVDREAQQEKRQATFFLTTDSRKVEMMIPGGPADTAGIAVGDVIESVNGIEIRDSERLKALADQARIGDELQYRIRAGEGSRDVVVRLDKPYRMPVVIASTATTVVAGAVFLLISMLVYWSRSSSRVALVFFLMCLSGAGEYLVWAVVEFDLPSLRGIAPAVLEPLVFVGLILVGFFAVTLMNTLLHLSLVFPREHAVVRRWPQVLVWIHTLPFVMSVAAAVTAISAVATRWWWGTLVVATIAVVGLAAAVLRLWRRKTDDGWAAALRSSPFLVQTVILLVSTVLGLAFRLLPGDMGPLVFAVEFVLAFVIGFVAIFVYSLIVVVVLYRSYRDSGVDEKRQLRWPLWGTLTAVGASVVLFLVSVIVSLFVGEAGHIDFTANAVLTATSKIVYLLIPFSFAFGILKYRLMEIDVIIRKTVVYSAVTGLVLVVYLLIAGVSGLAIVRSAGLESQAATVVATLLVVALFVPMRNWIQRLVDRFFFRRERDTQASIARVTETVMQTTSLEAMSLGVAEEIQKGLGCRTVAVLVRRAGSDRLIAEATVGLPDRASSGITLSSSSPVLETASEHVVVDRDVLTEDEQHVARQTAAVRAVICRRGDEPVGLITVGRKLSREPFDDEDEVFLEAVAGQFAIGLGRLRGRRAELEFTQALQIQRSLLPAEIPQIDGFEVVARWQPAREVSGDYYDVLELSGDRLAVCIGDVVGKGMPAALLMSSLQAAVKAVASADADPAHVCTQVRSVVTSNLQGGKFVTFFFAVVDGGGRRLTYTNCGHNQPVLVRSDGTSERLTDGGPAFARLMRDLPYRTGEVDLESGDRLVLFTDGVSEAEAGDGEQFGEDRIVELAAEHRREGAADLERTISETVLAHAEGSLQDDLTLVVVAVE